MPGIGKSRLVWELLQTVEAAGLTIWRQGRCLPWAAAVAVAAGEFQRAANLYDQIEAQPEAACCRCGQRASGHRPAARPWT